MMWIQIVLILALAGIAVKGITSRNTSKSRAYKKLFFMIFIVCAIIVVLFPEIATQFARLLGVGRGADLLLYGVTVIVIMQLFNRYIKDREEQYEMVLLARKIALLEHELEEIKKNKKTHKV